MRKNRTDRCTAKLDPAEEAREKDGQGERRPTPRLPRGVRRGPLGRRGALRRRGHAGRHARQGSLGRQFIISKISNFLQNFANFWRARSRLYQNEILQENMRSAAFFKLYKICILLHRCNLNIFAKIGLKNQ